MALDLLSTPFPAEAPPPKKRRRLGWDVPDPALYAEAACLQFQIAAQLMTAYPALFTTEDPKRSIIGCSAQDSPDDIACAMDQTSWRDLPCSNDVLEEGNSGSSISRAASPPWLEDDKDGHFNFDLGDNLTSRYKILKKMGEGTFGRVLECWDRDSQELVAIKVVRSAEKYREAAVIEVDVLHTVGECDKTGSRGCVQMRRWFEYRNHFCIVFEKLGPSLYDFLRTNGYRPFSVDLVRDFGRQLLESVAYMHSLSLIHTDLKPENVLLVSSEYTQVFDPKNTLKHLQMKRVPKSTRIKLIDFGSTTFDKEYRYSVVSTRHYRAPEVILGCGWSYPCDIWSIGCILIELCSGEVLFQTHENLEHLAMMEHVLGPIPSHVIKRSTRRAIKYFRHGNRLNWPDRATSRESIRAVHRLPRLRDLIRQHADSSVSSLVDLLEQLLKYDPLERLTAEEALAHPFFKGSSWR